MSSRLAAYAYLVCKTKAWRLRRPVVLLAANSKFTRAARMEERHFRPRPFGQAYRIVQGKRRSMVPEMSTAQWERVFTSRKRTMMQKASDLEKSTRCEVTLTIKSPAGQVWYYATSDELRQKLANAGIINSKSFRVTRETLENNLIPTPESFLPSGAAQWNDSPQHDCHQSGLSSSLSSSADNCPNCQANKRNLENCRPNSTDDNLQQSGRHASRHSSENDSGCGDDHILRSSSSKKTNLSSRNSNEVGSTTEKKAGNKKKSAHGQSCTSKLKKNQEPGANFEYTKGVNSTQSQSGKRKANDHDNLLPSNISSTKLNKKRKTDADEILPQSSERQVPNQDKTKGSRLKETNARQRVTARTSNKISDQNGHKNNGAQTTASNNKKKESTINSKLNRNNHIVFSESEDDSSEVASSKYACSKKDKPAAKGMKEPRPRKNEQQPPYATKITSNNGAQAGKLSYEGLNGKQVNSSRTSKNPPKSPAGNFFGFARFPFQPSKQRFATEAELEQERKNLASHPSTKSSPPKPRTTEAPFDSSSSTSTSSDSSSSSEDSSDEDESSSSSSSSSSTDDSPVCTPVKSVEPKKALQTTTTVETVESPTELHAAEKSPPLPKIFLSKYEDSIKKGKKSVTVGNQASSGNPRCSVKVEKNPYDFLASPVKVTQADNTKKTVKENQEKGNVTGKVKPNNTASKKKKEGNPQTTGKVNQAVKTESKPSTSQQGRNGKAIKTMKGDAGTATGKKQQEATRPIVKQEYTTPHPSYSTNASQHTELNGLSSGELGKNSNNVKANPGVKQPAKQTPSSNGKSSNAAKPAVNDFGKKKPSDYKQTSLGARKRHASESSNCSYRKARSRTPDSRPYHHPLPNYRQNRRNSESEDTKHRHFHHTGQHNLHHASRNIPYAPPQHARGHTSDNRMPRDDCLTGGIPASHSMKGRNPLHDVTMPSHYNNNRSNSAHSTPKRPFLLDDALDSLAGYHPLRRQHSATSLDALAGHRPYWGNLHNQDACDSLLFESFERKDDFLLDDFEKQLRDNCFSLRNSPPKYQRFDEEINGGRRFSAGGFRNPHLDRNLRTLSESSTNTIRGSQNDVSSRHDKINRSPMKKKSVVKKRKSFSRPQKARPQRCSAPKAVAKVKPFNQSRNKERGKPKMTVRK